METPGPPRELPIVAGHLALDFANTVDDPGGAARWDHIADVSGLLQWSERVGILTERQRLRLARRTRTGELSTRATLDRAHLLRHVVGAVFVEVASASPPRPGWWEGLRPFVAEATGQAVLTSSAHRLELTWPQGDDLDSLLHPVSLAAADLLRSPDVRRVKQCAGCPWLFLDRSKNASRRWCAMNDCGTHEKIRRYVERRAARRRA